MSRWGLWIATAILAAAVGWLFITARADLQTGGEGIDAVAQAAVAIVVGCILVALYFLPSIVASRRRARLAGSVLVVNFFLGWTFLGWVVALAMAMGVRRDG